MGPVGIGRGTLFLHTIYHTMRKLFWPWGTITARCPTYGLRFKFAVDDAIGRCIYCKYGVYSEHEITQFILHEVGIRPGDLVLDIGANIGWYALTLSSETRPRLFAFEPDALNFALLTQNIQLNGRDNITAVNAAVGERPGHMMLHRYKRRNMGRHSLLPQQGSRDEVQVQTVAIDPFLQERGLENAEVRFLKIDIEGYELVAMGGALRTLSQTAFLLSEFSPALMRQNGMIPETYLDLLRSRGFELHVLTQGAWKPVAPQLCDSEKVHDLFGINRRLQPSFTWPGGPAVEPSCAAS